MGTRAIGNHTDSSNSVERNSKWLNEYPEMPLLWRSSTLSKQSCHRILRRTESSRVTPKQCNTRTLRPLPLKGLAFSAQSAEGHIYQSTGSSDIQLHLSTTLAAQKCWVVQSLLLTAYADTRTCCKLCKLYSSMLPVCSVWIGQISILGVRPSNGQAGIGCYCFHEQWKPLDKRQWLFGNFFHK